MQLSLERITTRIAENVKLRLVFYLAAALLSILIIGYHFGTFDQSVHIPFLKATVNKSLYANDPFIGLRKDQYSYFWYFFTPFLNAGLLELALFIVHFLSTTMLFHALWLLGITLFQKPLAALFSVLTFIIPHTGFVGFPVIEFSLLSRTFVLPFLILAINGFLNRRYGYAFIILGFMYNLNLLMTNFVLCGILITGLATLKKGELRRFLSSLGFFVLAALPVLIWKLQSGSGIDFSVYTEWYSAITRTALYQIFYLLTDKVFVVLTIGGVCAIGLFYKSVNSTHDSEIRNQTQVLMAAFLAILVFGVITAIWLPLTFLIQMQINRVSIFILILGLVVFSGKLADNFSSPDYGEGNRILLLGSTWLSVTPIFPFLVTSVLEKWPKLIQKRKILACLLIVILVSVSVFGMRAAGLWAPGIYINSKPSPWVETQLWVKAHTPEDAVFITPPHEVGLYQPDWRVFSERATVASLYDIFEVALKPDYYSNWRNRFNALAPGALDKFDGNFFINQIITKRSFNALNPEQIKAIACKYSASYFVTTAPSPEFRNIAFFNSEYIVYRLNEHCTSMTK